MSKMLSVLVFVLAITGILVLRCASALISWNWWRMLVPGGVPKYAFVGLLLLFFGIASLLEKR